MPTAFKQCIERCMEGLIDEICIPYLDDKFSLRKSFSAHVEDVRTVFRCLRQYGIKLELSRLVVYYLECIVSGDGSKMNPTDIITVRALKEKRSHTVRKVRAIIGLLSYHRQYIRDFSCIHINIIYHPV